MSQPASTARRSKPAPPWDAPFTVALLVAGVINATQTVAAMRDRTLAFQLDAGMVAADIGRYTSTRLADGIGWAIAGVSLLALIGAIGLAVPRLRTKRRAFWVPLVAAVVSSVVNAILIAVAFFADPAVIAWLARGGR